MSTYTYTLLQPVTPNLVPVDQGKKDVYGYDIAFQKDFVTTPSGDYKEITGVENVKAAIYRRLLTRPGEYKYRPTYGVGIQDFVLKPLTQANLDTLRQRIVDQLSLDTRLTQVDVAVDTDVIGNTSIVKVYVKAVVGGGVVRFEPFTFSRSQQ